MLASPRGRKSNNVSRFHGGVSPSVGLLSRNNKSTRYAANLQTAQTPDSVITLGGHRASETVGGFHLVALFLIACRNAGSSIYRRMNSDLMICPKALSV
jgi:hypothetical protein